MAGKSSTTIQKELNALPQATALGDCLVQLYDKCLWTDVKFRCKDHEDGEFIQAHKLVLAARSPVFQAMFFGPCSRKENEIVLKTAKSETLQLFLRYLYCDQITLTEEKTFAVLEIAHCYQVSSLVQYCADYLTTVISVGNVCGILTYAMQYDLTNLRNCCCSLIDNNAEEVFNSDGFMNLSAECLLYILKGDTLNADEKLILEASEKWSRRKINERGLEETGANIRKCLGEAFYYLRLPTMTSKSFMECICKKGYFSVEEYAYISAFISEVPGVSVYTNSCVKRCSEKEMLTINDEGGDLVTRNGFDEVVNISVSKDVALTSFLFCEVIPVLKFDWPLYDERGARTVSEDTTLSNYKNEAISVSGNGPRVRVCSLVSKEDIDLPQNLQAILSCSVVVKDLNFKHTFSLQLSESQKGRVMFEPPLVLKKRSSPYRVELKADFGYRGKVLIKSRGTDKNKIQSPTGQVKIETQYNGFSYESSSFAGIKAIELINFPNRDRHQNVADESPQKVADETPQKVADETP